MQSSASLVTLTSARACLAQRSKINAFESMYRVQKSYLQFQVEGATEAASQQYKYNTGYFYMGAQYNISTQYLAATLDFSTRITV